MIYPGNPILNIEHYGDKYGVVDLIANINDNEICNIEMQIAKQDTIIERLLFYWCKLYSRQIKSGDDYSVLQKTIVILIANFDIGFLKDLEYFTTWKIIEENHRKTILTDKFEICIIELPKIIKLKDKNDELLDWLFFLRNPKSSRVVEKMKVNKELKQANEKLKEISNDEQLERLAWWRYKAILEENTARSEGLKRGINQGIKKGIEQEKEQIIINMLKKRN